MAEEKLEKNKEEQVEKNSGTNDIKIEQPSLDEKLKETEDKLLRSLAETENQRRRFEKEIKEAFEYGGFNFAKENLAILDNLQRAKVAIKNDKELKDNKDLNKFLKNLDIIENDLVSIFEKNNIKKINSTNQQFDPNKHQAMLEIEHETLQVGSIVQEIQAGYMFGERLLRPSFVSVAKKKTSKEEKNNEKKDD
ncbi:MAG: molecular chaperone GrpE [Pelagibacterales bacterium]|nr:molecular chaperone GrpE [Pelagibacterales bacterium]